MGYYYRGLAYLEQSQFQPAIGDFDHAISLRPDFAQPHVFRGEAYFALGLYDKAIEDETKGISLRPERRFLRPFHARLGLRKEKHARTRRHRLPRGA